MHIMTVTALQKLEPRRFCGEPHSLEQAGPAHLTLPLPPELPQHLSEGFEQLARWQCMGWQPARCQKAPG